MAGARLEEALARHSLPEFLRDRAVFIDEFDTFNAPKKRLLGAMLAALPSVTVALCDDGAPLLPGDLSLFSGAKQVAAQQERERQQEKRRLPPDISLARGKMRQNLPLRRAERVGDGIRRPAEPGTDVRQERKRHAAAGSMVRAMATARKALSNRSFGVCRSLFFIDIEAPRVAKHCQPGQFVIVKTDEKGERIPLTVCDYDREQGSVTIVFQTVGASTTEMAKYEVGESFMDFVGRKTEKSFL